MSRWSTDPEELERRIARALIVQEHGREDVDALDHLAHTSDRDPAAGPRSTSSAPTAGPGASASPGRGQSRRS
jgi:hypothetical protein